MRQLHPPLRLRFGLTATRSSGVENRTISSRRLAEAGEHTLDVSPLEAQFRVLGLRRRTGRAERGGLHARTGRSPLPCKSLSTSVFVAASGTVHPCTVYDRPLGNAYQRPLPEILATAEADDARRAVRADACPGCWSPCEAYQTILANLPRALAR